MVGKMKDETADAAIENNIYSYLVDDNIQQRA